MPDLIFLSSITATRGIDIFDTWELYNQSSRTITMIRPRVWGRDIFDMFQVQGVRYDQGSSAYWDCLGKFLITPDPAPAYLKGKGTFEFLEIPPGESRTVGIRYRIRNDALVGRHYIPVDFQYKMK